MSRQLEIILRSPSKEGMVEYLSNHPEDFPAAVEIALGDTHPLSWRAAWALVGVCKERELRLSPFIPVLLDALPTKKEGHRRELLKLLMKAELKEDQQSRLYDFCVASWEQVGNQSSVRYYAFQFMYRMTQIYPELIPEVLSLSEPQYVYTLSQGIRKSILKQVQELKERT